MRLQIAFRLITLLALTSASLFAAERKYTKDVAKLAAAPAPAPGGILMVGSSIFRKWTSAADDLAPLPVTNRGFGGSKTDDQLFFFDQIVPASQASLVMWYCGSNDISAKRTPESILKNTKEWISKTQAALPQARILIVSVIRAPQKREKGLLAQVDETNKALIELAQSIPGVVFADVNPSLETATGESVMECYVSDKLHLTPEGYQRMTSVLKPVLEKNWKPSTVVKADDAQPQAAVTEPMPRYFSARPGALTKAKERIAAGDKVLAKALKKLMADAEKALAETPPSVMSKVKLPPSADKHDYMSIAPYFWPNPETKDGLPYVRHDGKVNPESRDPKANDSPAIKIMGDNVETLSLAYYFTGKETYAEGAAKVARAWFLDPATRMNPHLKYAQAIMGVNDGRGTGILEALHISVAADALSFLAESKAWSKDDQKALKEWLCTYHDWLMQSDAGKDEHNAKNNHGTFFDVQAVRLALVLGRDDSAKQMLEEAKQRRIAVQIDPEGKQPLELDRATSFSYSRFNLFALTELATLGDHAGVDLWNFATADGRSIRKAIDYMLPYADLPSKPWPLPQIKDKHESEFMPIFRLATLAYGGGAYEAVITKYEDSQSKRFQLLTAK